MFYHESLPMMERLRADTVCSEPWTEKAAIQAWDSRIKRDQTIPEVDGSTYGEASLFTTSMPTLITLA
jgi:hypothetical protein